MKKILAILIAGVISSATFVYGLSDIILHEPQSDDPTMEYPLFVVAATGGNTVYESLLSVLEDFDIETYVLCLSSIPSDSELESFISSYPIDVERIYIVTDTNDDIPDIYAACLTPGENGVMDAESVEDVLEKIRSF